MYGEEVQYMYTTVLFKGVEHEYYFQAIGVVRICETTGGSSNGWIAEGLQSSMF